MKNLSKDEMKKVMGGSEAPPPSCNHLSCKTDDDCKGINEGTCTDTCKDKSGNNYSVCSN